MSIIARSHFFNLCHSDLKVVGMAGIGNYAVRLDWNDFHSSGL